MSSNNMSNKTHSPAAIAKAVFAENLRKAMEAKGWSQAELARRASKFIETGVGRYSVSTYLNASVFPGPAILSALAKALNVGEQELAPEQPGNVAPSVRIVSRPHVAPVSVKSTGNGLAELQVLQETTWEMALSVARMLEGRKAPEGVTAHLAALKHTTPKFSIVDKADKGVFSLEISVALTVETDAPDLMQEALAARDNFYADLRQLLQKYNVILEGN